MNNTSPAIFPDNLEILLGFDKIRIQLSELCVSEMGREFVHKIKLRTDLVSLDRLHGQTAEMLKLLESNQAFPVRDYLDIRLSLKKASIEGTLLNTEEWSELKTVLKVAHSIHQFSKLKTVYAFPNLPLYSKETPYQNHCSTKSMQ